MKISQPSLGRKGMIFFLIALGAFPPLTMDMYLPALPDMTDTFGATQSMVNLTLAAYMIAFAFGLLFWGPLSERIGRKPVLLVTLVLYIVTSLLCALVYHIEYLIGYRILQGIAGGGVTVIGTTIVKDMFDGRERERVMAVVMSLVIIAPIVAPVLGALLLQFASWHIIFVILAVFASCVLVLVFFYQETLPEKSTGPLYQSWGRLGVVVMNPRFAYLLLTFSLAPMCLLSFLGVASYVYVDRFGMTEQGFSYIFAFNAVFAAVGPVLYMRLSRDIAVDKIIQWCFGAIVLAGIAMFTVGPLSFWAFAAIAALTTVAVIMVRIPGANLLLDQQTQDTGSAAALIQFSGTILGAIGVQIVSAISNDLIHSYAVLLLVVGTSCSVLWVIVRKQTFVTDHLIKSDALDRQRTVYETDQ